MKNTTCHTSKYNEWISSPMGDKGIIKRIENILYYTKRSDLDVWEIMKFDDRREEFLAGNLKITNGEIMVISGIACQKSLRQLKLDLAGKHGPVSSQEIHDVMCNQYCNISDFLREIVMKRSSCSCLELSTQPDDIAFIRKGDWCQRNTAVLLCNELEYCGTGGTCQIEDFHCPRREYNLVNVPLKGFGSQCNAGFGNSFDSCIIYFIALFLIWSNLN